MIASAVLQLRFGRIETDTPYSPRWVAAVKAVVPSHFREWNGAVWTFDKSCYLLVREITLDVFGSLNVVDKVPQPFDYPQFAGWLEKWETYRRRADGDDGYARSYDGFGNAWDGRGRRRTDATTPPPGTRDRYSILHLKPDAPWEVVQAAYRALSKLHHPDRGGDSERMKEINAAYEDLRRSYAS